MLINRSTSLLNHTATLIICPKNDKTCRAKLYHFDWPSKKERIKGWDSEQFKNWNPRWGTPRIEHKTIVMYNEFSHGMIGKTEPTFWVLLPFLPPLETLKIWPKKNGSYVINLPVHSWKAQKFPYLFTVEKNGSSAQIASQGKTFSG